MAIIPVNPIPSDRRLYTNITPFTVRDNSTYIIVLEEMRRYINNVLIPFINDNVGELDEKWHEEVALLKAEVSALLAGQDEKFENLTTELREEFDQKISAVEGIAESIDVVYQAFLSESAQVKADVTALRDQTETFFNDTAQLANDIQTIPDSVTAGLVADGDSLTHGAISDLATQVVGEVGDATVSGLVQDSSSQTHKDIVALIGDGDDFVGDAVSEWWCHPVATQTSQPYERTVFGAIAADGQILACEINNSTGRTLRVPVGVALIDDHNAPALWIEDGRSPVILWTDHNKDNIIKLKVGAPSGDLETFADAELVEIAISGSASYTQVHKIRHKSTAIVDCFWVFTRSGGDEWGYVEFYVNQNDRSVTFREFKSVVRSPRRQCYISTADAFRPSGFNQVIRFGWGYNPAQPVHDIYYMEIDVVSGIIGSPVQPSFSAVLGETIIDSTSGLAPLVPTNGADNSRRFFYCRPGPDSPGVAFADWDKNFPGEAEYRTRLFNTGGHLSTNDGWISTPSDNIPAFGRGFDIEVVFTVPETISNSGITIASMTNFGASSAPGEPTWFMRLSAEGNLDFAVYENDGTGHPFHTSTGPLSGDMLPGTKLGLRVNIDVDANHVARYVSRNDGPWEMLGTGSPIPTSGTLARNGIRTSNRAHLKVPHGDGTTYGNIVVHSFSLKNRPLTGELAGVDFTRGEWLGNSDRQGNVYALNGSVSVTSGLWDSETYGVSGERVGYTEAANYIAGMAFETPSSGGRVVTAHTNGENETLRLWDRSGDNEIVRQDTSEGRIIRPIIPVNSRAGKIGYTNMIQFGETFKDYQGDWHTVTP